MARYTEISLEKTYPFLDNDERRWDEDFYVELKVSSDPEKLYRFKIYWRNGGSENLTSEMDLSSALVTKRLKLSEVRAKLHNKFNTTEER